MTEPRAGDSFRPGDLVNNTYRIEAILGRGGTSEVYRARSDISGRVVAIKVLRAEFSRNDDYLALMTREEEIREIRHPAIVRYFDTQRTDDGLVYLVMDYVDGTGLEARMKAGPVAADDLLTLAARVAGGLVAAHERHIVHRNLSPDNIILKEGDPAQAVIIDFGIAKDTNPGAMTIVSNEFAEKYAYAAPEQLSGDTDARSDLYALGQLLLAAFRGRAPDPGRTPMEVVQNKSLPPDLSGVPEPLAGLIARLSTPDPAARLQSAREVLAWLDAARALTSKDGSAPAIIRPRPSVARPGGMPPPPRLSAEAREASLRAAEATRAAEARRRRPNLRRRALMVVLLALGAAGGGIAWKNGLFTPAPPPLPQAQPFTLQLGGEAARLTIARGYVPDSSLKSALSGATRGADVTLAQGALSAGWAGGVRDLPAATAGLPAWRLQLQNDTARLSGEATDAPARAAIEAAARIAAREGGAQLETDLITGPRLVPASAVQSLLEQHQDCGDLRLLSPPPSGDGPGATIGVSGDVSSTGVRVALADASVPSRADAACG